MKTKNLLLVYALLFTQSCSKKKNATNLVYVDAQKAIVTFKEVDVADPPKVELVNKIEPFIQISISEGWDEKMWTSKIGTPTFHRKEIGVTYLEYIQDGPYKPSGKKLVTGVIVSLVDGITTEVNYHYTSFGL